MPEAKSKVRDWLTSLVASALLLRSRWNIEARSGHRGLAAASEENTSLRPLEVQIHLAEYDALMREHELLQKMRQELGVYALAAAAALVGAFIGQITYFSANKDFIRVFLVIPFFFTLMSWWYVRTNYSAGAIELYIISTLQPKLSRLVGTQVLLWVDFLYTIELSTIGKIVLGLQTISRLGLIQGPAIVSLLIFYFRETRAWKNWDPIDQVLMILNLFTIGVSVLLMIMTMLLISRIRRKA